MDAVRKRLNSLPGNADLDCLTETMVWGLEPAVKWAQADLAEQMRGLSPVALAEMMYDVFKIIATHTRLAKKYENVLDDADAWSRVETGIAS